MNIVCYNLFKEKFLLIWGRSIQEGLKVRWLFPTPFGAQERLVAERREFRFANIYRDRISSYLTDLKTLNLKPS